jgi:hypothetical protein
MHPQTYGFKAFFTGDEVAFIRAETMERVSIAKVVEVERVSDREWLVELDSIVPSWVKIDSDCLENITHTPNVEIRGNYFTHTSTRGVLVTSPKKVVVEDNVFCRTGMSAILIEGDASGWYESGPVKDVMIRNNTFIECGYNGGPKNAVIAINPSNKKIDAHKPVHENISIENNIFKTFGNPLVFAKSTKGISFIGNEAYRVSSNFSFPKVPMLQLVGCKGVVIKNNKLNLDGQKLVSIDKMKKGYVSF